MILLLLFLVLPFSSADILSGHLTNNVDITVNPCEDFFLHVCSQSVNATEFPFSNINKFYLDMSEKYGNITRQSGAFPIVNEIFNFMEAIANDKQVFNSTEFVDFVRTKCEDNDSCYREEFRYFSSFYTDRTNKSSDRLNYFISKIDTTNRDEILEILPRMVEATYANISATNFSKPDLVSIYFYAFLITRVMIMEKLKEDGVLDKIADIKNDIEQFKTLIVEKLRKTPWMKEEDNFGLTLLPEFEDKIRDLTVYYDFDESDRNLELLKSIIYNFTEVYYQSRNRSSGVEMLDIYFSLNAAQRSCVKSGNVEPTVLAGRVEWSLSQNAYYARDLNSVVILAPYLYPALTDNDILNKNYALFNTVGHEIFHSIINKTWAERSLGFKKEMECYNAHFNSTCGKHGMGSCNSGDQTFTEDGPDLEGLRINYKFLTHKYNEEELKEVVFKSPRSLESVTREQAFFYLTAIEHCDSIKEEDNHVDQHSHRNVRVNGILTQMPEFSNAFSCTPGQVMYTGKEETCNLFGTDSE